MNQSKTKIILKNESRIQVYTLEKLAANTNSPISSFRPKDISKIADYILSNDERLFLRDARPAGVILFARNVDTPEQVRRLVDEARSAVGEDILVLIDQEGGRVQRLRPPHWRDYKPMKYYGDLYAENPDQALEELRFETLRMAEELVEVGINVDCAPTLDLFFEGASNVIGDRSFSDDPDIAARLGLSVCRHFLQNDYCDDSIEREMKERNLEE